MLSTQYRLRLESICKQIVDGENVKLEDMIWAQKLAKRNTTAATWMRQARQKAANPDMKNGGTDDFLNKMGLGEPDPSDYRSGFNSADDISEWFNREKPDDWRQRD
jgi:hypothetical protein|tara:strand:+ start:201 stop:518 length:318 start_codon:yes stop_codon:yes gene_type:complete